ncbi:aquaporin-like protein, partial [Lentinula edodes]
MQSYTSVGFGFAVGISLGVWVSVSRSGRRINPAVTIALATFRKFPWRMVPGYIFSQLLGGFIGAALIYANYYHAINIFEGGSVLSLTSNITPIMMHHLRHATLLLLLV